MGGWRARSGDRHEQRGDRHEQRCERPGCTDSGTDEWIVVHVTCQRELKFALRGVGVLGRETGTIRGAGNRDVQFRAQMNGLLCM